MDDEDQGVDIGTDRGPYRVRAARNTDVPNRPSAALARNLGAYRGLRHVTQDELAGRMTGLGHDMSRSTISAIESSGRSVTIDEMFGFAISLGVTIGQLLDPTGPDHSRADRVDVGLRAGDGSPQLLSPWIAHLIAASRVRVTLPSEDRVELEVLPAADLPAAAEREFRSLG